MSRWWSEPRVLHLALPQPAGAAAGDAAARTATAIAAACAQIDRLRLAAGTRLHVVVSDALLRYRLVPWHPRLARPAQRQALAEQAFAETFGAVAARWTVLVEPARHGQAGLACAIDTALTESLVGALQSRQLQLHALQPLLGWVVNPVRRQLDRQHAGGDSCFVLQHETGSTWLWLGPQGLQHVHQMSGPIDLWLAYRREWFSLGAEGTPPPLVAVDLPAPDSHGERPLKPAGWPWRHVSSPSAALASGVQSGAHAATARLPSGATA